MESSVSRLQIGLATSNGSFFPNSRAGDAVIRTLGGDNSILFVIPNSTPSPSRYIGFGDEANGLWMRVRSDRTVRIDGTVFAREINVQTNVWADYVFANDYKLLSLDEVEQFITENQHLPGMPKGIEIESNGINVAEISKLLLEKIEELTLYVIELNKENKKLKAEINLLNQ
jgi:hypothetical protein